MTGGIDESGVVSEGVVRHPKYYQQEGDAAAQRQASRLDGFRRIRSGAALDVLTPSPVLPLPPTAAAINGVAGLGTGADGEDSSGIADSVAGAARHSEWETLICAPDWDCETALRIVWCESGWNPAAISWTGESFGLFQIHAVHAYRWANWSEWMIPEVNTAWAFELWLESGWGIWDCW